MQADLPQRPVTARTPARPAARPEAARVRPAVRVFRTLALRPDEFLSIVAAGRRPVAPRPPGPR